MKIDAVAPPEERETQLSKLEREREKGLSLGGSPGLGVRILMPSNVATASSLEDATSAMEEILSIKTCFSFFF